MKKLVRRSLVITLLVTLLLTLSVSLTSAAGGDSYHTVRYGETLFSIGRAYNVNPYVIADSNDLYNPDHIYAGQVLYIPSGSGYWDNCGRDCGNSWDNNNNNKNNCGNMRDCNDNGWDDSGWNNCGNMRDCNDNDWNSNNNWNNCDRGNNCSDNGWDNTNWNDGNNANTYVVRKGDTLYSIARRYGVTVWAIADANGIYNIDYIYYGQRLHIPSGGGYY
jgi:LysM repeat protein